MLNTTGSRYQRFFGAFCILVSEQTSPLSSSSDFGFVTRLTIIVTIKLAVHDTPATINACPNPLRISYKGAIHPPFPSAMVNPCVNAAAKVPASNPQKAPWPVVLFQNMPNKKVANSGPFTKLKTS